MNVLVKSSNGITQISADTKLFSQRKIFIEGEITPESACDFIKKIIILNAEDSTAPIDILINSPGGDINSGLAMYDTLQSSNAPIRLFCIGKAYSMSAILFACSSHGTRFMLPNSELLLHQPILSTRVGGNCSSIKSISDSLLEAKQKMILLLAKHTGKSAEEIENATNYDHYFSPEESKRFGLCDQIVDFKRILEV